MVAERLRLSDRLLEDGWVGVMLSASEASATHLAWNKARSFATLRMTGRLYPRLAALGFTWLLALPLSLALPGNGIAADAGDQIKLLISIEQQSITAPFPARVTLHLHNAGQQALWLYRKARTRPEAGEVVNGSTLGVRLEPVEGPASRPVRTTAVGTVLESVGLPRPRLMKLAAGEDFEEKAVLHLEPARAGGEGEGQPLWGRYRLSVVYGASYANADAFFRSVGVRLWQGESISNTIEIELLPTTAQGSLSGRVINPAGEYLSDTLVSLSDAQERLVEQDVTGVGGRFAFSHLPAGFYWVTSRLEHAAYDTTVFRHVELTPEEPESKVDLVYIAPEAFKGEQMFHKPVLFRVFDDAGHPFGEATLEISFTNGTVIEDKKLKVADDGTSATELIFGSNIVTLKRRGCGPQDQRVEVPPDDGIEAFKLVTDCPAR
jgi:hypothetical protein